MRHVIQPFGRNFLRSTVFFMLMVFTLCGCQPKEAMIIAPVSESERVAYGVGKLSDALSSAGYKVTVAENRVSGNASLTFLVGTKGNALFDVMANELNVPDKAESFVIRSFKNEVALIGNDATGAIYACLDLARRITEDGKLKLPLKVSESPEMVLRGTCIGLQKTEILPGRHVYEYPYTPDNFPWFYDKKHWIEYLDMLAENRFNSLYLWNGHPFASLVKLEEYPYALEVDEATFALNEEMYNFIASEADKRGIWLIQMFYNIILSQPFAEHHGLQTQSRGRGITPLIADYTQKSITAFIEKYPNVGLLVTLGEAMQGIENDVQWFTQTIIPGVKDGLANAGITTQPPIVLRGHDTDAERVMKESLPIYSNLYTMYKYNGEALTTYEPRNQWADIPKALSELGSVHISNVHILANLEPFRYGSPDFIQKSVIAMHDIQGANGLHLYPQTSYWDWPYTADKTEPRTRQIDRDWIWYKAWGRYAWDCRRDRAEEEKHWQNVLAGYYGSKAAGGEILKAYEEFGEIAPKLLRRFGISDGNRQSLLLGQFMSQLVNPFKWTVYQSFLDSNGPEGEILVDWARKEWNKEPHVGETPPQIITEILEHGRLAVEAIEKAAPKVKSNRSEFERLRNDVHCYDLIAKFFAEKVEASKWVLRYKYSNEIGDLEKALPHLEKSVEWYDKLAQRTRDTYLYCNSMQTQQRRVPIAGTNGTNKTWDELLVHYQSELNNFKRNLETLKNQNDGQALQTIRLLEPVEVKILNANTKRYSLVTGEKVTLDAKFTIDMVAPELQQLSGVLFSDEEQGKFGTNLKFVADKPVKVVVGYYNGNSLALLTPPTLETNALANDRGEADIRIANAMIIKGLFPVNVYTYHYEAGTHELALPKGRVLILGFIDGKHEIRTYDAGISKEKDGVPVDWLFY
jgi:tetratricopeptide (TPR) repeat protein